MLHKKIFTGIILFGLLTCLTSCAKLNMSLNNFQKSPITEDISINNEENTEIQKKSIIKEYLATKDDGSLDLFDDYDTVLSLCCDACTEFVQAVKQHREADFSQYIDNSRLREYMQYRVDNHVYGYSNSDSHKLLIEEVKFHDDYVFVNGILAKKSAPDSKSLEGNTYFLIRNIDGKLSIVDWYWDSEGSPDITFRDGFSIENNLTYWDDSEKYSKIIEKIK